MSSAARRVRRVRLAGPSEPLVRRGAVLLEDALHTASIPGAGTGRLVLIRSLNVGRIRPGAAPSTLALAIEQRLRDLESSAIWAGDADDDAPAVWFADAAEAAALLAVTLARGAAADAWFWRAAVPGWRADAGPADGIRLALHAVASTPQGPAAVAEVLRRAREAGVIHHVLAAIDRDDARVILARCGWAEVRVTAVDATDPHPPPSAWRPLLERWVGEWEMDEPRPLLLASIALVDERPARAADPRLPERAARIVRALAEEAHPPASTPREQLADKVAKSTPAHASEASTETEDRPRAADDAHRPASPDPIARDAASADVIHPPHPRQDATMEVAEAQRMDRAAEEARRVDEKDADRLNPSPESRREVREAFGARRPDVAPMTCAGGLFFLVAAMERLGMAEHLAAHPELLEADLPGRVLLAIAERLRIPADDPAVLALASARDALETPAAYPWDAPRQWERTVIRPGASIERMDNGCAMTYDATGRLLTGMRPAESPSPATDSLSPVISAWVTALRRWTRRYARMGLHGLVRRPGRISFTRTHVDVTLGLALADPRIRAAGLDLDPGWVPWMGRVIAFHYTDD